MGDEREGAPAARRQELWVRRVAALFRGRAWSLRCVSVERAVAEEVLLMKRSLRRREAARGGAGEKNRTVRGRASAAASGEPTARRCPARLAARPSAPPIHARVVLRSTITAVAAQS